MGKITLRNVEFVLDVPMDRDARRSFDIEGNSLADIKEQGQKFADELAQEFDVDISRIKVSNNAILQQNRFLVF